ncbi:hypothetical protein [Methylobacterium trifolii]|uniref:Uncharacterized protein n=1 Tax=Methylobacterium trifolii TaxID=1003092 RepID=A0ABQ4U5A7_9HYPH|nr:hypothetical protein [Methylobacterium trifolii]GJE62441.1 hypothetical protein MPOCJGCO_4574 [Methylobacterium trifolii]
MVEAQTVPFRNDDWSVSADGLEHRATGYFIDGEALAARRGEGLWDWPLQMAEKRWCRPSLFREAFLAALDRFGIERDAALTESFALGYGIRAGQGTPDAGFVALGDLLRGRPITAAETARTTGHRRPVRAMAGG